MLEYACLACENKMDLLLHKKAVSRFIVMLLLLSWAEVAALPALAEDFNGIERDLTVEDITVEGNRLVPTEDILGVVKTRRGDKFDREQVLNDLKAINGMGYFDDRNLQVVPEVTPSGVLLKIRVQENAPVTGISVQGNEVLPTELITQIFQDQLGKPQNLSQLSASIEKIENFYHEQGFVLARVVDVKDDPDGSINLIINEGKIDQIEITGNKKTKDFIIRQSMKIRPGTIYNERQLTADLRKLYSNGYFQDIRRSLAPSTKDPDKYVLKVEIDERRTGSVGVGGGVDTMAGPFGSFSFSDSNFTGRGQGFSFQAQGGTGAFGNLANQINNAGRGFLASRRTFQVEGTWVDPNFRGTDTSVSVSTFARDYNSLLVDYAAQRTYGASVTFSRPIKGHENWHTNLGFTGEKTRLFDVGNFDNGLSTLENLADMAMRTGQAFDPAAATALAEKVRAEQLRGGTFLTINPSINYDTRDRPLDPTRGTFAKVTAGPSVGLSGATFAKMGASYSKFVPVTKNVTLAFNMQGGSSVGGVPNFAQYRLGGFNGLRGYRQFSDLGSGTAMLMASAELRTKLPIPELEPSSPWAKVVNPVVRNVRGVAFFDVGQVSGNKLVNSFYQRSTLGASVGLGLRLKVPMLGLVRLDYGFPIISTILGKAVPRFTIGFGDKF